MSKNQEIRDVLRQVKQLAQRYRSLTGKPLGVTGEVAEYEAACLLDLALKPARTTGFDAIEHTKDGGVRRLQIKGRCILHSSKSGQRIGSIDTRGQFDAVLMVLLDDKLDATAIYEVDRRTIVEALSAPGSKARNERGALGVAKFKAIGRLRWKRNAPA